MNWKGYERKRPWPNLRCYHGICLEGLRETTKNLSQDSRSPGRDSNSGPPEYKARALTSGQSHSVLMTKNRMTTFRREFRFFGPEQTPYPTFRPLGLVKSNRTCYRLRLSDSSCDGREGTRVMMERSPPK
jgi:hypothetical protein